MLVLHYAHFDSLFLACWLWVLYIKSVLAVCSSLTELSMDASDVAFGAVLMQELDGSEHPVCFLSI